MGKVYRVGRRAFPTKAAVTEHVSAILNAASIDTEVTGEDVLILYDLLALRKDKLAEIGSREVVGFERGEQPGSMKRTRCFWALLDDGAKIDMSVYKAIRLLDPTCG